MAGSMKDALINSGTTPREEPKAKPDDKKWREELPDDEGAVPFIPFDKPALLKPTERAKDKPR